MNVTHPTALPHTTTEIVLPGLVEPSGLQVQERQMPVPGRGEVLVRLEASGVSFAEKGMRRGRYPGQPAFPFVLGYDLVGTVRAIGGDVDPLLLGTRVAAVVKTGGWASYSVVSAADLVPVPATTDPAEAETVVVNGVTAWQMLHRSARVAAGGTVLVHGANGGVGTILAQLARHHGVRVIGTAAPRHHEALRALGVEPLDYDAPDLAGSVRALAPTGVDAVFDHLGLDSARASFDLLAPRGALVVYGTAASLQEGGSMVGMFVTLVTQLTWWKLLPNGHRSTFYNFWAGHLLRPQRFRRRLREDLVAVLALVDRGVVRGQVAARVPLREAAVAMQLAESRTVLGKVVLVP